ncbi:MAG: 2-C-methyl-D-erythritol 4-phosphate cytidylyltransferase [Prevotellaceae bacterium]|jgi:2-C-methyl-D-erythritol 4-phosphate cytidylyltransferase|nr:2-C-methyl-D-erythritol 4-phosphate cytidylyltransferase [Prevotellaceae bacterium]
MNIALIFAGGSGSRMNTVSKPKQFLELHGKPVIAYTLELFENHKDIDGIIVVCIKEWIQYLNILLKRFDMTKVKEIVAGGDTGQESIYNGLTAATRHYPPDSTVLVHDGVRPLINDATITDNIQTVREKGSCITCIPASETFVVVNGADSSLQIPDRKNSLIARAPQSFILADIWEVHRKAKAQGKQFIDSCTMMNYYGKKLATVIGPAENIKITTPTDFYIFRALIEIRENRQIFGL